jgi:hypothetical protein
MHGKADRWLRYSMPSRQFCPADNEKDMPCSRLSRPVGSWFLHPVRPGRCGHGPDPLPNQLGGWGVVAVRSGFVQEPTLGAGVGVHRQAPACAKGGLEPMSIWTVASPGFSGSDRSRLGWEAVGLSLERGDLAAWPGVLLKRLVGEPFSGGLSTPGRDR